MIAGTFGPGAVVGKYRVERELGRGGMGVVYLAEDLNLSRRVALKVLYGPLASDMAFAARFTQEARLIAEILHPNVVRVNNLESTGDGFVIDMEYVAGGSLAQFQEKNIVSPEHSARIARDILEALRVCHARGVVHRDIKPTNILLTNEGSAKLADFGLATVFAAHQEANSAASSSTGFFLGTPRFAPPESWDGALPAPDWDLYSLGLVLYEIMTGKPVYDGASPLAIMKQVTQSSPASCRDVVPHISCEYAAFVDHLIARDRSMRPRSAAEALNELRSTPEFAITASSDSSTVRYPLPVQGPGRRKPRKHTARNKLAWGGGALTLLVAVVFAAWYAYIYRLDTPSVTSSSTVPPLIVTAVPGSDPMELTMAQKSIYFSADDGIHGRDLWRIKDDGDSTPERIGEKLPDFAAKSPRHLFGTPGMLYFCAETPEYGAELYTCVWNDAEEPAVRFMRDIMPGAMGSDPMAIAYQYPTLLFRAGTRNEGEELWVTLGRVGKTAIVADLQPGSGSSLPESVQCVADKDDVFFTAYIEGNLGQQLCRYRFSENSIRVLHDVSEDILLMAVFKGMLFYKQTDDEHGSEIWTDSLKTGESKLFMDMVPGKGNFIVRGACVYKDKLIFSAETRQDGLELWATDGTPAGTTLLRDIWPGPDSGNPTPLRVGPDCVWFTASDGVHGRELWATDGSTEGTAMVADIWPGKDGSGPYNIVPGPGHTAFTADDGEHGEELWMAEARAGKYTAWFACDLYPGKASAFPHRLAWMSSSRAFVAATSPSLGRELCRIDIIEPEKCVATFLPIRPGGKATTDPL